MAPKHPLERYQSLYSKLIRLYPESFRKRFALGMLQTFDDLCRERKAAGKGLVTLVLWTFGDTAWGILRERAPLFMSRNRNILRIGLVTGFILLIPFAAMQFTDEVNWNAFDFAVAGALLFGAGLVYELLSRKASRTVHRAALGLAIAAGFILIWTNLAVGLIGSENNPANLLYVGVLVVGFTGAIMGKFRPQGMARALFATAAAQALVPIIAMMIWKPQLSNTGGLVGVFIVNSFFVFLFVVSGLLFRRAQLRPHRPFRE